MFKKMLFLIVVTILGCTPSQAYEQTVSERIIHPNYAIKKEEIATKFLQQYETLNPVVLLIDSVQQCHDDAFNFIKNVHKLDPKTENINFMIMKFNTSGVSSVLEATKNNRMRFEKLLNQPEVEEASHFLGRESTNRSAVFFGILNAVYVSPPIGAIVVFMKRSIEDEALAQHALAEVKKKRIRVFVFWVGKNDASLLREFAENSDGAFWANSDKNLSQVYYDEFLENLGVFRTVSTILSRKNLRGEYNLNFPIDSDVTGIHISITPNITTGILTTPRGYKIDVLDSEKVTRYSAGSFMKRDGGIHEIHLNTTTATTQDVGVWRFRISNARAHYNITIFAHTKLTTNAFVTVRNQTDVDHQPGRWKKIMKLGVIGDISSISNISLVGKDGKPILDNVKFTLDKDWENSLTESIEINHKKELNITVETIPEEPFYAVVDGKDSQGHSFRRLSYVKDIKEKDFFYLPPITIEVGLASELITQANRRPQLYFEVTNNGNSPTLTRFFCKDERAILLSMNPWYKWINPQETTTVQVTLITRPGGFYKDFITFTAVASETVSKNVIVDVGSAEDDRHDPQLHYQFNSDCIGVLFGSCEDGRWTVEVKAKDTGSGLLQIASNPKGLYIPNGFTTGTKEEVTGIYSESCCNPDLEVIAFDRRNNRKTKSINAYRANLGPGAIAAIVLGVILLILIIIAIVLLSRKYCVCPRKDSYDLPVYRGPLSSRRT